MSLLFAERPLVINTQLAMKIGLNEAIVLQQLHYWLRDTNSGMECDGVRWIYNTTEQWLEQFPFWSESTLKRAFASLKKLGLLRCVWSGSARSILGKKHHEPVKAPRKMGRTGHPPGTFTYTALC